MDILAVLSLQKFYMSYTNCCKLRENYTKRSYVREIPSINVRAELLIIAKPRTRIYTSRSSDRRHGVERARASRVYDRVTRKVTSNQSFAPHEIFQRVLTRSRDQSLFYAITEYLE